MKYVWFLCKQWYLARLNLEKDIFKAENETIYSTNYHLWRSRLCPRTENTLMLRKAKEAQVTISREKQREIATFCSITVSFWYFCVASCDFCIIQLNMPWKFGFPLKLNFVLRLIWICRIHWMHWMYAEYAYSLFSFSSGSILFS